jgi:hypothetical protein
VVTPYPINGRVILEAEFMFDGVEHESMGFEFWDGCTEASHTTKARASWNSGDMRWSVDGSPEQYGAIPFTPYGRYKILILRGYNLSGNTLVEDTVNPTRIRFFYNKYDGNGWVGTDNASNPFNTIDFSGEMCVGYESEEDPVGATSLYLSADTGLPYSSCDECETSSQSSSSSGT